MKFLLPIILISFIFLSSCKNNSQKENRDSTKTENVDTNKIVKEDTIESNKEENKTASFRKEFDSKYICPMHCKGSGSDKPGTCPVCGMEYIQNPDYQAKK